MGKWGSFEFWFGMYGLGEILLGGSWVTDASVLSALGAEMVP